MPKNKGSKKAAAKAPKCTCDDPYKCVCGNRPERPTRGHKWDPDSQQWGGKGHKQKGGSGQTSMTAKSIQTTAIGKTQISEWQKLPTRLLNDFCKKDRRPFPKFKALDRCKKPGNFKFRVIIQDAKVTKRGGEHDFIFIPAGEVSNEEQAREESALLALLHFTPTLPHERTLPEPYKTTWLNTLASIKEEKKNSKASSSNNNQGDGQSNSNHKMDERKPVAKPMSTNVGAKASSNLMQGKSFTSLAEKRQQMDAKKKERNAKIRKHEAFRMANKDAQVFMSAQIRKQIESFLRGNVDEEFMKALTSENEDDIEKDDEDDDIVKSYVIERLVSEGFSKSQAKTSYLATMKNPSPKILSGSTGEDQYMDNVYEECLQWLCIHLNEDQLPEGFDPRGRTLDVVMPTKAVKKSQSNSQNENDTPVEVKHLTEKYGLSIVEAMLVFKATKNKGGNVVDVLHNALYAANKFQQEIDSIEDIQRENIEMNQELANDEIEVLQSMFVIHEDLHIRNDEKNCIIKINMISMDEGDKNRQLIICYERGLYPQTHPKVYVEGGWKEGQGTSFHVQLTNFVISLSTEEPMIFEIYGHVQELLSQLDDNASPMIGGESLIEFLDGGKEYLTSHTQTLNKSSTSKEKKLPSRSTKMPQKHCRPRQKSFFWSKTPKQTPPAISFPKLRTVLEVARKRLPAAKARSEFLSVMEEADRKNRVVLVTGETGCGKVGCLIKYSSI
jgi:ATP-dependent RNA helicase DHX57